MFRFSDKTILRLLCVAVSLVSLFAAIEAWAVDQEAIEAIESRQKLLENPFKKESDHQIQIDPDRFSVSVSVPAKTSSQSEFSNNNQESLSAEKNISVSTHFLRKTSTIEKKVEIRSPRMSGYFKALLDSTGNLSSSEFPSFVNDAFEKNGQWWIVYDNATDVIAYNQSAEEDESIKMTEWIYARKPNTPTGSRYNWSFSGGKGQILLKEFQTGRVGLYHEKNTVKNDQDNPTMTQDEELMAILEPVIYWTNEGEKREGKYEISGRNKVSIAIHEPKKNYPLVIDPTINWGSWLGNPDGSGTASVNAIAINGTEIYAGGVTTSYFGGGAATIAGTYSNGGNATEGFVVEMTDFALYPSINWLQWVGGADSDTLNALAVNGDEIYAGGNTTNNGSFETVNTVQGTMNIAGTTTESFVVEITDDDTTGIPTANWVQYLGAGIIDQVFALAVNGDEVYAGGYSQTSSSFETLANGTKGTYAGTIEGWVVEIADGDAPAGPSAQWMYWIGGAGNNDAVTSLAVNGDEIFAGGYTTDSANFETIAVGSSIGTYTAGAYEGFVVKIPDGAPPNSNLSWLHWLGAKNDDEVLALAFNGDEIYAGGFVSSPSGSFETFGSRSAAFGNKIEGFVAEIADTGPPTLPWVAWVGSNGNDEVESLAVVGEEIYAGGYTSSTAGTQGTGSTQGTYSGGTEGMVAEILDNDSGGDPGIDAWYWLGNDTDDEILGLAVCGNEIYAGGFTSSSGTADIEAATKTVGVPPNVKGGMVFNITDAAPINTPAWLVWLGGAPGNTVLTSLAVNGDEIYAGGYSSAATLSVAFGNVSGTMSGGLEGMVAEIADGTTPTLNWLQWIGGTGNDQVMALAVNGDAIYAGGFSSDSTTNMECGGGCNGGYNGTGLEGWTVALTDGASTPSISWRSLIGGGADDQVLALAVNGSEIYAGGYSNSSTVNSWELVVVSVGTFNGLADGFVVEIGGGTVPYFWRQWLGGTGNDKTTSLAVNGDEIYAGGYTSNSSTNWDTVDGAGGGSVGTFSLNNEGWVVEIADNDGGGNPKLNWLQWEGGTSDDRVLALAIKGDTIYAGGYSSASLGFEGIGSTVGTFLIGGTEGFVTELADGATPTVNWLCWLGSEGDDQVTSLAVTGNEIYAGGFSSNSSSWDTLLRPTAGTAADGVDGWVVEIQEGSLPSAYWMQWLGGDQGDQVFAIAVTGDEIYAGGITTNESGWETPLPPTNGKQVGFIIEVQDDRRRIILVQ